ncbi:MAG: hypothetical protein M0C28_25255 [Candidatus Moduliflexus flocculans]|nr:hypothetical protein [Candidatus Moduliflexus flocculans]
MDRFDERDIPFSRVRLSRHPRVRRLLRPAAREPGDRRRIRPARTALCERVAGRAGPLSRPPREASS